MTGEEREGNIQEAIARIRTGAEEFSVAPDVSGQKAQIGLPPSEMWMLLLVRMATRVSPSVTEVVDVADGPDGLTNEEQKLVENESKVFNVKRSDELRETLCNYVLDDFPSRCVDFPCHECLNLNFG